MLPHKQLSLEDFLTDCQLKFENDKPAFLSLLEQHINLDEIIPASFYNNFYASTGRTRKYPLHALLWALIIQRIFSIPTDSLLLVFLRYSKELRDFCGFTKVPDASKITRFKQDFLFDLQVVFDRLVDLTEPICKKIETIKNDDYTVNEDGIPCCPHDSTLPMKPEGSSKRQNGVIRFKFSCPKVKWTKGSDGKYRRHCFCESPCTNSRLGG